MEAPHCSPFHKAFIPSLSCQSFLTRDVICMLLMVTKWVLFLHICTSMVQLGRNRSTLNKSIPSLSPIFPGVPLNTIAPILLSEPCHMTVPPTRRTKNGFTESEIAWSCFEWLCVVAWGLVLPLCLTVS